MTDEMLEKEFKNAVLKEVISDGQREKRLVQLYSVENFDSHGNTVYFRAADIEERTTKYEYNSNGDIIHSVSSYGSESWNTYNSEGKRVYSKEVNGFGTVEEWYEYTADGKLSQMTNASGRKIIYEYDANGRVIHETGDVKPEKFYEYDEKGNLIHDKSKLMERWYEYDEENNLIHEKQNSYDSFGNVENSCLISREYDKNGNEIHFKFEYYGNENLERHPTEECWYEFEFYENGKVKTKYTYSSVETAIEKFDV